MARKIKFSVHRNPLKDTEGQTTYQVRHESYYTANSTDLKEHLKQHGLLRPEVMEMTLDVLKEEIIEFLTDNKRLHINGFGTFYLKVGFKKQHDETGNEQKPHFTNPADITGHDIGIETIGFIPDKSFLNMLNDNEYGFENMTGRGRVGHSKTYKREEIIQLIDSHLDEHGVITRQDLIRKFGLTKHAAIKLLESLTSAPDAFLSTQKIGCTFIYHRRSKKE
ncbi:hypothetical protein [Xylanibacter muris]|uniref:HU domain-containing protein n=1 Tax=Xylanibacter muris TaxID=2736290 RepID=A0ABX2AP13_9BACT|nr:hypothetical protein [Xylanibacter muris]NPD91977.1 hypothetical protein [Xylanibacter muris]